MRVQKLFIPKKHLDSLKKQSFISNSNVRSLFILLTSFDERCIPDFKISRVYAKSKFYQNLREEGLLSYNDRYCFIAISRTHSFLWYPFSEFLYIMEKAPFDYARHAKHFYKRTSITEVPVVRFIIGKSSYPKGLVSHPHKKGQFETVQENILLREFQIMFNGITAITDILKTKVVCGGDVVSHRTFYFEAMDHNKSLRLKL